MQCRLNSAYPMEAGLGSFNSQKFTTEESGTWDGTSFHMGPVSLSDYPQSHSINAAI